uniref:Uncharacterized protein n=1 Tax=Panagrolaimus sp. PS1159 TaxID=55785 RepID=A0AC35GEV5_9BILA
MDPSKSDSPNALSLKELLFVKSNNSIAERVKMFLPKIAKANAELEEADEETRQAMIMEQIEQLKDDSSSDESDSSDDDSGKSSSSEDDEEEKKDNAKGDHVEIVFTKFEERETDETTSKEQKDTKADKDDFIIRRSNSNEPKSE